MSGESRVAGTHPVLTHPDGASCIWVDGGWYVPYAVGEMVACTQEHPGDAQVITLLATQAQLHADIVEMGRYVKAAESARDWHKRVREMVMGSRARWRQRALDAEATVLRVYALRGDDVWFIPWGEISDALLTCRDPSRCGQEEHIKISGVGDPLVLRHLTEEEREDGAHLPRS